MAFIESGEVGVNAGAFLAQAASEGLSGRAALAAFRDAGLSMGNQQFRSMYSQVQDALAGRDRVAGIDYGSVPSGEVFTDWAAGADGGYATFVTTYVRPEGTREIEPRYYIYSTDDPHSPQEAIDAAEAQLVDAATGGPAYGPVDVEGSVVTSMTRTKGR